MSERPPKVSIPVKRIETLIKLAKEHNLAILEVGHIRIVPEKAPYQDPLRAPAPKSDDKNLSDFEYMMKTGQRRDGRKLNSRQMEDLGLFGPNGITDYGDIPVVHDEQ